ncbi:MAG TPA: hypothetical protein VEI97_06145 [bacterium]|nr:hypothetical protein [bacterium]
MTASKTHWTRTSSNKYSNTSYHPGAEPLGNIFFVCSATAGATDASGYGLTPELPFATLDYAIGQCTASNSDFIYVLPGHAETHSASGTAIAFDVAGVTVIGVGEGADRPTFTFTHTAATWTVSAASVKLKNVLLYCDVDAVVSAITISGTDCTLEEIEWRDQTAKEFLRGVLTTAAADRLRVLRCHYNGATGGDACVNAIRLVGCDQAFIEGCKFLGKFDTAVIQFLTTACTKVVIEDCDFLATGVTNLSKNVVDTVGGSTWEVKNSFDLAAGAPFSGGSGATFTGYHPLLGKRVTKATADTITNGSVALFTVSGGRVLLTSIYGEVTTVIGAGATNSKLVFNPTTGTTVDMCANLDIDADEAGSLYSITGTPSDAMLRSESGAVRNMSSNGIILDVGDIEHTCSADRTGSIQWTLWYIPLDDSASVAAA